MPTIRIISIGALAAHPLWGEKQAVRTGHATCTLVRSGKHVILVDPGLPPQMIEQRLSERAGLTIKQITHVFLTSFKPDTTRGLRAFDHAAWLISQPEREGMGVPLAAMIQKANAAGDRELADMLLQDVALLRKCQECPDHICEGVDLFPLPGVSPGLSGLLIASPRETTLICGDAIPTIEHLEQGQVLQSAVDVAKARESFQEAVEIADLLVLGRDNMIVNPIRRM